MEKNSFSDSVVAFVMDKLAEPMSKLGDNVILSSIRDGLVGATPIIVIGSLFLLLGTMGQPWIGEGGPLLPFLAPYSGKFLTAFSLTMNCLALYASISTAISYAKHYKLDLLGSGLLGLMAFLLITTSDIKDGTISLAPFAASGLMAALIAAVFSVWVYHLCKIKNLVIRMPRGVPQGVGNAFSALIPFVIVAIVTWGIRSMGGFDFVGFLGTVMKPVFAATDNIVAYTFKTFLQMLLWVCGLHGDNMLAAIVQPLVLSNVAENAKALSSGVPINELPYIWTTGLERMTVWPAAAWPLIFWMYTSKVTYVRALAGACTPAAIFTIIEPLVFGLPVVMNPYLLIPFILSATVAGFVVYGAMALHVTSRVFIELPWATPPPVFAYLATGGDWKAVGLVGVSFLIGLVIYYPFFKVFEKSELAKEQAVEE